LSAASALPPAAETAAAKFLLRAIRASNVGVVRRLLATGVDPNVRPGSEYYHMLHEVVIKADVKGSDMVSHTGCGRRQHALMALSRNRLVPVVV
jgi:hypothetical protein